MKKLHTIAATIIFNMLILLPGVYAATNEDIYPQDTSNTSELREDLPAYVFEYDLERLYPATYEFYKKLDTINRDKVYSHYLYHPKVKDVRHKIFEFALSNKKGKSTPAPYSLSETLKTSLVTTASAGSSHSIVNSVTISTINLNSNF